MSEEKELPKSWVWTSVGEIYDIVGGGTPSTSIDDYWDGDIDWATSADIYGLKDIRPRRQITKAAIENSATNLVPEGSLIVVTRVGLGKVALTKMPLCFSQDSQALINDSYSIYPDYSLYYLSQAVQIFKYQSRGTTIAGVTKKQLSELPFALPPLAEQHRIVEAIELQFSRLDAGVAALQRAKAKLKRYRASVLKAAVEGKLTETWRAEHPTTEPASALLERILKERHAKWEADLRAKGKDPAKVKYIEPTVPDVRGMSGLPKGWIFLSLNELKANTKNSIKRGPFGSAIKKEFFVPMGYKVYEQKNAIYNDFSLGHYYINEEKYRQLKDFELKSGDIAISCSGTIGEIAIVPSNAETGIINQALLKITLDTEKVLPQFFILLFKSNLEKILLDNTRGSAMQNIASVQALKETLFSIPSLEEQKQIIAEVERHLSLLNQLEVTIEANLKRAERLRQSILREAFAGRLVPQEPTDEPASVLLERIRNERNNQKNNIEASNKKSRSIKLPESVAIDVVDAEQVELWESVGN